MLQFNSCHAQISSAEKLLTVRMCVYLSSAVFASRTHMDGCGIW